MTTLVDFAVTERHRQVAELVGIKSHRQISKELGITRGQVDCAVRTLKARASKQGWSPEHDMTRPVPDTHHLKGTSTLYGDDGEIKLQWVKTSIDHDRLLQFSIELAENICETVVPIKPRLAAKLKRDPDRIAIYPLPDLHIGLYCGVDGQEKWNSEKAEEAITERFEEVLAGTPHTETALIANLGDFFHTDNYEGVTGGHGHALDTSERWSESLKVGFRLFRKLIDSALLKHEKVKVICASGNHDVHSSVMLSVALESLYSGEPRCEVETAATPFHFHQFGKCLFGITHGHKAKPEQLYRVMCEDQKEAWGQCLHHHWFTGHFHSQKLVDIGTQQIETFRTPIPRDAYAQSNGYRSSRGLQSVTFHKEFGEVNRTLAMM